MKNILDFISKHKSFVKKIILFTIYTIIVCLLNNETVVNMFNKMFGESLTNTLHFVTPFVLMITEVK